MNKISTSDFCEVVYNHSYFLIDQAIKSLENGYYNLATFYTITSIEEIANNIYSYSRVDYGDFDITSFIKETFPIMYNLLNNQNYDENIKKFKVITKKFFNMENNQPREYDISELKKLFRLKGHKNHTKKTLKSLIHSISINSRAYNKLGPGFIDQFIFMAELGIIQKIRNMCLYVGVENNRLFSPEMNIPKEMAVDFISLALESILELKNVGKNLIVNEDNAKIEFKEEDIKLHEIADNFYADYEVKPIVYVGKIKNFLNKISVIIVDVENKVTIGDELIIYNAYWKQKDKAISIQNNYIDIKSAVAGQEVGIKIKNKTLRKGLLFKVDLNIKEAQIKGTMELIETILDNIKKGVSPDIPLIDKLLKKALKGLN